MTQAVPAVDAVQLAADQVEDRLLAAFRRMSARKREAFVESMFFWEGAFKPTAWMASTFPAMGIHANVEDTIFIAGDARVLSVCRVADAIFASGFE